MRIFLILILCLISLEGHARGGGSAVAPCSISVPSEASAVGFTTPTFCDHLTTTQTIDIGNTRKAGFNWYWPLFSTDTAPPASANLNDGTGSYVEATENSMTTASGNPSGGGYIGHAFGGGFFAQVTMKWVGSGCANQWPVFWFQSVNLIQSTQIFYNHEIDVFEFVNCTSPPGANVYERTTSSTAGYGNSNNATSLGSPTYSNYHTYGVRWRTQAQTGGAGTVEFYFDHTLQSANTVTYTTGGAPSPTTCRGPTLTTGSVTCPTGTFSTMDTDMFAMILQGVRPYDSSDRAVYKDAAVWQMSR